MIHDPLMQRIADLYIEEHFDGMPSVPCYASPISPGTVGHYSHKGKEIHISLGLVQQGPEEKVKDTIKHELIHAWLHWKKLDNKGEFVDEDHNEHFIKKALELDCDIGYLLKKPRGREIYERLKGRASTKRTSLRHVKTRRKYFPDFPNKHTFKLYAYLLIGFVLASPQMFWGHPALFTYIGFWGSLLAVGIELVDDADIGVSQRVVGNVFEPILAALNIFSVLFGLISFIGWLRGDSV